MNTTANKKYQYKLVAFLDILGFKTLNLEPNEEVFKIMKYFQSLKKKNYDPKYEFQKSKQREVTILSDSIVISEKINYLREFFAFLFNILYIQKHLAQMGIFLRGGISIGKIYHKNDIVFGPAMIEAHLLEDSIAMYPRVIIINSTIESILTNLEIDKDKKSREMLSYLLEDYNKITEIKFIDYLGCVKEYNSILEYLEFLNKIKNMIIEEYRIAKKDRNHNVILKYNWLISYYNSKIKDLYVNKQINNHMKKEYLIDLQDICIV